MNHPEIAKALRRFIDEVEKHFRLSRGRPISQSIAAFQGLPLDNDDREAEYREKLQMSNIIKSGWELVDHLTGIQLDTRDLRRFLFRMDYEKQESTRELWCDLMPNLEKIAIRLKCDTELPAPSVPPLSAEHLSDGARRILDILAKGTPLKSCVIARKATLTPDYTRKLLSQLKKRGHVTHKKGEGYRVAGNVLSTC